MLGSKLLALFGGEAALASRGEEYERRGSRGQRILWCLWFALLVVAPYAPLDEYSPASALGPSSLSKLFPWVACGLVAGLWLASTRTINFVTADHRWARRTIGIAGVVLSALLVGATVLNTGFMLVGTGLHEGTWGSVASANPVAYAIKPVVSFVLGGSVSLAAACGLLCGWCGWLVFHPLLLLDLTSEEMRANGPLDRERRLTERLRAMGMLGEGPVSHAVVRRRVLLVGACFVLGIVQPLSWMLLLPHSPFPQPTPLLAPAGAANVWSAASLGLFVWAVPLPALLTFVLAVMSSRAYLEAPGRAGIRRPLAPVAALCVGALGFRVISRVAPNIHATPLWLAAAALAVYVALYVGTIVLARQAEGCSGDRGEAPEANAAEVANEPSSGARVPRTAIDLQAALTPVGWAFLAERGLTEQETLTLCAHVLGLSSAEASEAMGVGSPTVREYRRRCRRKFGVRELDDIVAQLPAGAIAEPGDVGADSGEDGHDPEVVPLPSEPLRPTAALALAGLMATAVLALLPFGPVPSAWSDVWALSTGIGVGIAAGWAAGLVARVLPGGPACGRAVPVACAYGLVLAVACLVGVRLGIASGAVDGTARRALLVGTTALVVSCGGALLGGALRATGRTPLTRLVAALVGAACAAALCGELLPGAWAIATVLAAACGSVGALREAFLARGYDARPETREPVPAELRARSGRTLPLCWACAVGFFAWLWGETWRSQALDSVLGVLQWGVLACELIALWRLVGRRGVGRGTACLVAGAGVLVWLVAGAGEALVVGGMLLAVAHVHTGASDSEGSCGAAPAASRSPLLTGPFPWHDAPVLAACGILGGTLVTNALGSLAGTHIALPGAGGEVTPGALAIAAIAIALVLTTAACLLRAPKVRTDADLGLSDGQRVRRLLMERGLSGRQVDVALLLAEGRTVREAADELCFSRSTIAQARTTIYRELGVRTREELAAHLDELGRR